MTPTTTDSPASEKLSRRRFTVGLLSASLLHTPVIRAAGELLASAQPLAPPSNKLVIYQLFTRLFGNQNQTNKPWGSRDENGTGKFNDITDRALRELKAFGITHVWYTGVLEHATMTDYTANGIKKDNPLVVKGRAGSPYAIKDYYDVDPDLAVNVGNRMQEFEALIRRTHANGLKLIIDFIPNHVARQYQSDAKPAGVEDLGQTDQTGTAFDPQNNFYYLPGQPFQVPDKVFVPDGVARQPYVETPAKATGNDVFKAKPSIDDWYETIKLNYGVDYDHNRQSHFEPVPSTWIKMRDILLFWSAKGVDGFRCDVAELVPVEFWSWAIPQVKSTRPAGRPLLFIAEAYDASKYQSYIDQGHFDYLYDKVGLYDTLRALMEGKGQVADISKAQQNAQLSAHMLRFLENHDEQRIASRFFAGDPWVALPAMTVSATMHTGPVMLYFGQELGVNPTQAEGFQGDDGRTTIFDYWGVPEFQAWTNGGKFDGGKLTPDQKKLRQFYQQLLRLVTTSDAIRNGGFYALPTDNTPQRLYSYLRYSDKQKLLIVCNFDRQQTASTTIMIPADAWQVIKLDGSTAHSFQDIFRTRTRVTATGSVPITLPPLGVMVLAIA